MLLTFFSAMEGAIKSAMESAVKGVMLYSAKARYSRRSLALTTQPPIDQR
jgi:hypothetical protein